MHIWGRVLHRDVKEENLMESNLNVLRNADIQIIDFTPENIANYGVCGYKIFKPWIGWVVYNHLKTFDVQRKGKL